MNGRALLVELIGLPGVGKTTLATEVQATLRAARIPVGLAFSRTRDAPLPVRRLRDALSVAALGARKPGIVSSAARAVAASRQRSAYDGVKVLHNWLNVTAEVERARRVSAVTLFDQGPCQALWSIGFSATTADLSGLVDRLVRHMPRPDLLVVVEADADTILTRLHGRAGRASRLDPARSGVASAADLTRPHSLLDLITERATGIAPLLRLDTSGAGSLPVNIARLTRTICDEWNRT